jgi:crotonobetainyl-CoA:carnitine CoA-transferase CaiB-like acyl-CoA transferase
MERPAREWLDAFRGADVPCSLVPAMDEVIADPQLAARAMFVDGPGESGGVRRFVANPLKSADIFPGIRRPAPKLGEHTDEVLGELGISQTELGTLKRRGAVWPAGDG